jgi:HSP20 family protein
VLPGQAEADKVTAALADGVLTVTVPTTEAGKPRRIHITG